MQVKKQTMQKKAAAGLQAKKRRKRAPPASGCVETNYTSSFTPPGDTGPEPYSVFNCSDGTAYASFGGELSSSKTSISSHLLNFVTISHCSEFLSWS
jgi:hypothetical protein